MARQTFQDRTTGAAPRRRPLLLRPAAAGLAAVLSAALAIPALTIAGGAAMAATAAGTTSFQQGSGPVTSDSLAVAGTAASRHVLAWGRNDFGQLGNGTSTDASTPVRVRLPRGTKVQQVRAGCDHTVALTSTGHVLAWGINGSGQLGNGSIASRETPVRVRIPGGTKVIAVRAGCDFSLALTSRGRVLAWGDNILRAARQRHHHRQPRPGPGPAAGGHEGDGHQRRGLLCPGPDGQRPRAGLGPEHQRRTRQRLHHQ